MAQNNNDSDQQTEIAVRQLQPPHTQAGSQTHRHITFSYQEKNKTFFFFPGQSAGKLSGRDREPRCLEGEDTYLGWSVETGKAMERAGAPGLPFTLQSGMTKPWLVPAEPGLEAQLCAEGEGSHIPPPLSSPSSGNFAGVSGGQSWGELSGLCASSAAFPTLSSFPSEDDVVLLRQKGAQPQHPCPAASSPASSSPSPRCPGGSAHRPPLSGTAHPLPAAFPSSFSTSRLQLPPPSADRGARSRTAPFSPRERKKPGAHLRRGSAPAALRRPRGGERNAAAAGERGRHRQMPRDGCRLADAAARHGSLKGLKRT